MLFYMQKSIKQDKNIQITELAWILFQKFRNKTWFGTLCILFRRGVLHIHEYGTKELDYVIRMYEGCSEINETLAINKLFKKLQFSFLVDM